MTGQRNGPDRNPVFPLFPNPLPAVKSDDTHHGRDVGTLSTIFRLNGNVGRENPEPLVGFPGLLQNHGP